MSATWHIQAAPRLWAKVDRGGPDECWPFTGSLNEHGYGAVRVGGRGGHLVKAHRLAWMIANDVHDLTPADHVCHRCDNPPCCNPAHLYRGSYYTNIADKIDRGRQPRGDRVSAYVKAAAPRGDAWWTAERVARFSASHCRNGHSYDDLAHVHITPKGHRRCRTCDSDVQRERRQRKRSA